MSNLVLVPHGSLSPEALRGVMEEFITREGTDYGHVEHSLEHKLGVVERQIRRGDVLIVFDAESESVTLMHKDEWSSSQNQVED